MEKKKCNKCNEWKDATTTNFSKKKGGKYGLRAICKQCSPLIYKEWAVANPEKKQAARQRYYGKHEVEPLWQEKEKVRRRLKKRRKNERDRATPEGKLNNAIAASICASLRGVKAGRKWESLVGYTKIQLKNYLEKRFTSEMNWGNYGTYWWVDHKIPRAVFNFKKPEDIDFKKCWALKNLQPLEAKANIKKGAKLSRPFQPSLSL